MKLTRLQRHTAYILMLAELEENRTSCLCSIWGSTILKEQGLFIGNQTWRKLPEILCELFNKRTRGNEYDDFWFNGYEERTKALTQCIIETY